MRALAGPLPIIMLTARADAESKQLGLLAGTDDYLVKPCQPRVLLDRVARLLERATKPLS
jgi:two-component system phosphate regulon response regulator OmpR